MTNKLMLAAMLALLSSAPALRAGARPARSTRGGLRTSDAGRSCRINRRSPLRCPPAPWCACSRPAASASPSRRPSTARTCSSRPSSPTARRSRCPGRLQRHADQQLVARRRAAVHARRARLREPAEAHRLRHHAARERQWIDAQATVIDGNPDVRLRRYRRTSDQYTGPGGHDDRAAERRRRHRGERESAIGSARSGARRSERAIRAEQPHARRSSQTTACRRTSST